MKRILKSALYRIPHVKNLNDKNDSLKEELTQFKNNLFKLPGHYYSPVTSKDELRQREKQIWTEPEKFLSGIDLNENRQLEFLEEFATFYKDLEYTDEPKDGLRYYYNNNMYSYTDAIFLYGMIRSTKPKRIIEVGSGFSSAVMLDTNNAFFDNSIDLTFVEPYPDRLNSILKENEQINLIEKFVQDVDLETFRKLEAGDILFIDSTHVSKTGSDVNFLFFNILPNLKKGVRVHIHDIFFPFEYPKSWAIEQGRSWNEDYLLRAFLTFNDKFKIVAFSTYLTIFHREWFEKNMPLCLKNTGGNIWLEVQ
ncbi:MAG: class I SAM-dependent methyltransferase [Nonlabens sp.]